MAGWQRFCNSAFLPGKRADDGKSVQRHTHHWADAKRPVQGAKPNCSAQQPAGCQR